MEKMSDRIVRLRKERGLTQEQLASYTGLTRSAIAKYERGLVENMTATNIQALADFFNVRPSYLMCLEDEEDSNKNNILNKLFLIPIVGKVPAGEPLLAEENIEGYLPIDPMMYHLTSPDNLFFLKVIGESMNNIVPDGAYVLIKKQNYAETGDVIVALVNGDNEATLKRFKQIDNNFVMLEPDSTAQEFTPRIINLRDTDFKIIGKVIGDFKKWN